MAMIIKYGRDGSEDLCCPECGGLPENNLDAYGLFDNGQTLHSGMCSVRCVRIAADRAGTLPLKISASITTVL